MSDICFVMMPFGEKVNAANVKIDFDEVYNTLLRPAIKKAGLEDYRGDEVNSGAQLMKSMYGRILLCDFAIADITFDNPNVFYELGVRHAVRPFTTILIRERNMGKIPFDLSTVQVLSYDYDFEKRNIKKCEEKITELSDLLVKYKKGIGLIKDSPIIQLFEEYQFPQLDNLFNVENNFTQFLKKEGDEVNKVAKIVTEWKLADALYRNSPGADQREQALKKRDQKSSELDAFRKMVKEEPFDQYRLLLAVLKAYKDINDSNQVAELIESIPNEGRNLYPELDEKLIFAYKMLDRLDEAETIIKKLLTGKKYNDPALMKGLLASIYKRKAWKETDADMRLHLFSDAVETYQQSFDEDPNRYYPGICMLNILYTEVHDAEKFKKYLPLVEYSIERRLKSTKEYWAYVSRLELEVLKNSPTALSYAVSALLSVHAPWKREVTAKHLTQIANYNAKNNIEDKAKTRDIINKFLSFSG